MGYIYPVIIITFCAGNKPQFSTLDLDVSQHFAVQYREREMEEKAEKQRLKELVLEMNVRQEEEEIALLGP